MHLNLLEVAIGAAAALAVPLAAAGMFPAPNAGPSPVAQTVEVKAAASYPLPGEFVVDGMPVAAPVEMSTTRPFKIMKRQVSLADYGHCVTVGACMPADAKQTEADVPVTGVSWIDAEAYARWYSRVTGETWRLPTAEEVAIAAVERFSGDVYSAAADDPANPSVAWIRRYREEAAAKRPSDPQPKPRGYYGTNSAGVEDFAGNVWEWTSTCYMRVTLSTDRGHVEHSTENCGVRILEGRHRAYMSSFVRDGKSGGCAVGTPPENLGFRLVHEKPTSLLPLLATRLKALGA